MGIIRFARRNYQNHCSFSISSYYIENCLLKCCKDHGLPKECLEEEIATREVSRHNETHQTIRIVRSRKCQKYSSIMHECKSSCVQEGVERSTVERSTVAMWHLMDVSPGHGNDYNQEQLD